MVIEELFRNDKEKIYNTFHIAREDDLCSVERWCSDKEIWKLTFFGGKSIIYKKKNLSLDKAYEDFFNSLRVGLPVVKNLDCGNYGWQEFINSEPEILKEEYYYYGGLLLGITSRLGAHDLFRENIMIREGKPLIVDAEMGLYPMLKGDTHELGVFTLGTTCLLPYRMDDQEGNKYNVGGISFPRFCLNDKYIVNTFLEGYRASFDLESKFNREYLLPFFGDTKARIVIHSNSLYAKLKHEYTVRKKDDFKKIARFLLKRKTLQDEIIDYEIDCILQGREPMFYMRATGTSLLAEDRRIVDGYATMSPMDRVLQIVQAYSANSFEQGEKYIRSALGRVEGILELLI